MATPGRIARRLAGDLWPDVQFQTKLARGVFWFSCAGHGGMVAVLPACGDLFSAEDVERARRHRKTETVAIAPTSRGARMLTSEKYVAESLREWASRREEREAVECWVGEEDCDWALLAISSERLREGMAASGEFAADSEPGVRAAALANAERWNGDWLAELSHGEPSEAKEGV